MHISLEHDTFLWHEAPPSVSKSSDIASILSETVNEKDGDVTFSYPRMIEEWTLASVLLLGVPSLKKVSILVNGKSVWMSAFGSTYSVNLSKLPHGMHTFTILFDQKEVKTFSVIIREKSWGNETLSLWNAWEKNTLWDTPSGRLNQTFIDGIIAWASKTWI